MVLATLVKARLTYHFRSQEILFLLTLSVPEARIVLVPQILFVFNVLRKIDLLKLIVPEFTNL